MDTPNQKETDSQTGARPIIVKVNRKDVKFANRSATGAEIKSTAISQGVEIKQDFSLFEILENGKLDPVGDGQKVTLRPGQAFRAVAPDDNSNDSRS